MIKTAKQKHNPSQTFANIKPEKTTRVFLSIRTEQSKSRAFAFPAAYFPPFFDKLHV